MNTKPIEIVDRGRGLQLSTCRITVQDVFPYFQEKLSHDQIREIMPVLTDEEISVLDRYIKDNFQAVADQDRRIKESSATRSKPAEMEQRELRERRERLEAARKEIRQKLNRAGAEQ